MVKLSIVRELWQIITITHEVVIDWDNCFNAFNLHSWLFYFISTEFSNQIYCELIKPFSVCLGSLGVSSAASGVGHPLKWHWQSFFS